MSRIIAVANQKGGVGKTTTSVNLAASMAAMQRRVMLVDMDPQGNATMGSGVDKDALQLSIADVLLDEHRLDAAIVHIETGTYDLLPGNSTLTGAEVSLMQEPGRELRLRSALEAVRARYDFILLDCPPAINVLSVNALVAADSLLIPMQCEYYALEGLNALMDSVEKVRKYLNPGLQVGGLLRTMYDPRNNLAREVSEQLQQHFGDRLYRTIIPRNVRLAEAPSHGRPVLHYDRACSGSMAYLTLAGEMLNRQSVDVHQGSTQIHGA